MILAQRGLWVPVVSTGVGRRFLFSGRFFLGRRFVIVVPSIIVTPIVVASVAIIASTTVVASIVGSSLSELTETGLDTDSRHEEIE